MKINNGLFCIMNRNLDVSVSILSYNRPQFIREAIESITKQSKKPKEIIIYDNGSDNNVKNAIKHFLNNNITWKGSNTNHSAHWNIRRAIKNAHSKYLFIMHDDDRLCPTFLDEQIDFLEKHPSCSAIACCGYIIDSNGKRTGILTFLTNTRSVQWFNSGSSIALYYSSGSFIPFPSILYRSEFVKKIEWRGKEFGKVADVVFLCDLIKIGPIAYQNKKLFEYRFHAGQDSKYFPEKIFRKLEDFYIDLGNASDIKEEIKRNVSKTQTKRNLVRWGKNFLSNGHFTKLLLEFISDRPKYFSLLYVFEYMPMLIRLSIKKVLSNDYHE